jgi:nicotinate phosphoribosyltransferase
MTPVAGVQDLRLQLLDEYIIRDLLQQGAVFDTFGVGERLITARSEPVFGGVYKLVAVEENGEIVPKIKVSENVAQDHHAPFQEDLPLLRATTPARPSRLYLPRDETWTTAATSRS